MKLEIPQEEVEVLLREALAARGAPLPASAEMTWRRNNKLQTFKVVFDSPLKVPGPKEPAPCPHCAEEGYTGLAHKKGCPTGLGG